MSRLVLVRHGESEWNVERRIQGQSGTGLTGRGREQAQQTAELLVTAYPKALLASSDLQRCLESVAPLEELLRRGARAEPGLRERHFGEWTGRLSADVAEEDPERWKRWRAGEDVIGQVGGEDTPTLAMRAVTTIRRLLEEAVGRPVICVTHGGPVWHGTQALLRLHDRVLGGVANGSVTEIDVQGGTCRLITWNQVVHLPLELRMVKRGAGGPPSGEVSSIPGGADIGPHDAPSRSPVVEVAWEESERSREPLTSASLPSSRERLAGHSSWMTAFNSAPSMTAKEAT